MRRFVWLWGLLLIGVFAGPLQAQTPEPVDPALPSGDHGSTGALSPAGDVIAPVDEATARFVQTLIANGQAAPANPDGSFPPGVTYEIVGKAPNGLPILRRRRFSMY
jgi:hypothetical protein